MEKTLKMDKVRRLLGNRYGAEAQVESIQILDVVTKNWDLIVGILPELEKCEAGKKALRNLTDRAMVEPEPITEESEVE